MTTASLYEEAPREAFIVGAPPASAFADGPMVLREGALQPLLPGERAQLDPPASTPPPPPEPVIDYGEGRFVRPVDGARDAARSAAPAGQGRDFAFRDADVNLVVAQVIGEALGRDFIISPDVRGNVTFQASGLYGEQDTLQVLQMALEPQNISLVQREDVVFVMRDGARAPGQSGAPAVIAPGERVPDGATSVIVSLRHTTPTRMAPLITPFAESARVALADDARNLLVLQGDHEALAAASETLAMFDVDWFTQVSTGVFPLRYVEPGALVQELRALLGPEAGNVELIALPRLSTLVVLAGRPSQLQQAQHWIERLDQQPTIESTPGLLVYKARYADAESLAATVQQLIGAGGGAAPEPRLPVPDLGTDTLSPAPGVPAVSARPAGVPGAALVTAEPDLNMVLVRGSDDEVAEIGPILDALDQPRPQVLIEASIVEVMLNDELQYGINWQGFEGDQFRAIFTDAPDGVVASRFPGFAVSYVNVDIEAAINLLDSVTDVEVISRPSVLALHNETALLQIGDQVPIVTQSAVSVIDPDAPIVNQTTYRDTGVILTVTPRVRSGGIVEIDVAQEVSDVSRTTSSGIDSPTISQRRIESTLSMPNGQAVAIGGLISTSTASSQLGVPVLSDVPLFGALFRTSSEFTERTELLVFITPRILMNPADAVEASVQLSQAMERLQPLIEQR